MNPFVLWLVAMLVLAVVTLANFTSKED